MKLKSKTKGAAIALTVVAALVLTGTPANAAGEFGSSVVINPNGGTTETNGLKIEIAGGQMQVFRSTSEQLYQGSPSPDSPDNCNMYNYFTVAIDATADKIVGCGYYSDSSPNEVLWASGTITSDLNPDQSKEGTVTLTLTSGEVSAGKAISLIVTYTYEYPTSYVDIQTQLTIPAGIPGFTGAKLYWNVDATLGGNDSGNQFTGTLTDGSLATGVISSDGTAIEAFNQLPNQNMRAWAGAYTCAWDISTEPSECPSGQTGWTYNGTDAPLGISNAEDIDNGWGVQSRNITGSGDWVNSWRAYFASCLDSSVTEMCTLAGSTSVVAAPEVAPSPVEDAPSKLAQTGSDAGWMTGLLGAAIALVFGGIALRRRSNA